MRRILFLAGSAIALVSTLLACSSDDPEAAGGAPGNAPTAQSAGLCGELTRLPERCAGSAPASACTAKITSACADLTGLLNPALVERAGTCVAQAACEAAASPLACIASSLVELQATDAQKALAAAYCEGCSPVAGDVCTKAFLDPKSDLGKVLLPLGDDVANAVKESCTGSVTCKATFSTCAEAKVLAKLAEKVDTEAAKCLVEGLAASGAPTPGAPPSPPADRDGGATAPPPPPPGAEVTNVLFTALAVPPTDATGSAWDAFGGKPDLRVVLEGGAAGTTVAAWSFTANGPEDTTSFSSAEGFLAFSIDSAVLKGAGADWLRVRVIDLDVASDDFVGQCVIGKSPPLAIENGSWPFDASIGEHEVHCTAPAPLSATTGTGFTLTYRLERAM